MAKSNLTAQQVREVLHYNPETGLFFWKAGNRFAGKLAGNRHALSSHPYVRITVLGECHLAHRLAWLLSHDTWPDFGIDHIDGDPKNNRLSNLRDVPQRENSQNRRRANKKNESGFLGVYWNDSSGKWCSTIRDESGKVKWLGAYVNPEDAHKAFVAAKRIFHKGCTL